MTVVVAGDDAAVAVAGAAEVFLDACAFDGGFVRGGGGPAFVYDYDGGRLAVVRS